MRHATQKLVAVGATSGADLATGFSMTVSEQGTAPFGWSPQAAA
jgi:hypothetical protein